jgi:ATP-dependent Clp protease ATP-binding subunit ClpB
MRLEKLTTKSQEALREAQSLADKRNHQALDVEHLLFSLLGQKGWSCRSCRNSACR